MQSIKFSCSICGDTTNSIPDSTDEIIYGFCDCAGWDNDHEFPSTGMNGRVRAVHPFALNSNDFWSLHTPKLSQLNGWKEHPDEIDEFQFEHFKVNDIIESNNEFAVMDVTVLETVKLDDISNFLPLIDNEPDKLTEMLWHDNIYTSQLGNFTYINASAQGDLGHWILGSNFDDGFRALAFGYWGSHSDICCMCNCLLSEETLNRIGINENRT